MPVTMTQVEKAAMQQRVSALRKLASPTQAETEELLVKEAVLRAFDGQQEPAAAPEKRAPGRPRARGLTTTWQPPDRVVGQAAPMPRLVGERSGRSTLESIPAYKAMARSDKWLTAQQIAALVPHVTETTVREHLARLETERMIDVDRGYGSRKDGKTGRVNLYRLRRTNLIDCAEVSAS